MLTHFCKTRNGRPLGNNYQSSGIDGTMELILRSTRRKEKCLDSNPHFHSPPGPHSSVQAMDFSTLGDRALLNSAFVLQVRGMISRSLQFLNSSAIEVSSAEMVRYSAATTLLGRLSSA